MRGDGRIFPRKGSSVLWCAYCLRGKEVRESTNTADPEKAAKYLKRRLREVENDKDGIRPFIGPQAERIEVSCGITDPDRRKPQCDCLGCALERDFRLRGKTSPPNLSVMKRLRSDFALLPATKLTSEQVDAYIERRLWEGDAAATVNRTTQMLGQAFRLAIRQKRLTSNPYIRHLSEAHNVRQGFYSTTEFDAIVSNLPEYLKDFVRFDYRTGMRKNQLKSVLWEDLDGNVLRSRAENVKTRKAHSIELDEDLIEIVARRHSARQITRPDGTIMLAAHIFHRDGEPIGDFRKAWQTACVMAGLGKFLCRDCEVTLEADRKCPDCGRKWSGKVHPKYLGRLFHDFRRTAVRDLVRAGVPESVAMSISGHKTRSTFERYNITEGRDQREALRAVKAYREQQTEREHLTPFPAASKNVN